jgi:methionyl aminopeptidase
VAAEALEAMRASVVPGVTTRELDDIGEAVLGRLGAQSAPRAVYGFPACTCISVNDEIVHGVPVDRVIQPGNVVKLDVTASLDRYIADAADTVLVPPASPSNRRLRYSAVRAFEDGLRVAELGERVNRIGRAVERRAHADGFAVIRELCGDGSAARFTSRPKSPTIACRPRPIG